MSNITVDRKALKAALTVLTNVVPKWSTIPALNNVELRRDNGELVLRATDLEQAAILKISHADADGEFKALLPAKRLADIVRRSKADCVSFASWGSDGSFGATVGDAILLGLDPVDFPNVPKIKPTWSVEIEAQDFREAIASVAFAVSREMVRYALTGILLESGKGKLSFVASNGKRLSAWTRKVRSKKLRRAIIPMGAIRTVERLVKKFDGKILLEIEDSDDKDVDPPIAIRIRVRIGETVVYTSSIEGTFPDWTAVVPTDRKHRFTFDRQDMIERIEQVLPFTHQTSCAIKFTFGESRCHLFARTADVGEGTARLDVDGLGEVHTVLDPNFVLDYLKTLLKGINKITVELNDDISATVWKAEGFSSIYVLMPRNNL